MDRPISPRKKFLDPRARWHLVKSVAKQAQDARPLRVMQRPASGLVQSTHGIWSQPPLHRRHGMKVSAAQPELSTLSLASPIRVRPFGLPRRFDEAPFGNGSPLLAILTPKDLNQPARTSGRYHTFQTRARSRRPQLSH